MTLRYIIVYCTSLFCLVKDARTEATASSPYGKYAFGYNAIKAATKRIYPEAIVAPSLMLATTDTRHYFQANLTKNIYR